MRGTFGNRLGYVSGTGRALWLVNFFFQRVLRIDANCRHGKHFTSRILHPDGLEIEDNCSDVRRSLAVSGGCYINAADGLWIGKGTIWSANVAIISQTHSLQDFREAPATAGIRIGRGCWIGFGAVVLPGVSLGDNTIIGANAVVTRSFEQGSVVITGAPASIVKTLDGSVAGLVAADSSRIVQTVADRAADHDRCHGNQKPDLR